MELLDLDDNDDLSLSHNATLEDVELSDLQMNDLGKKVG